MLPRSVDLRPKFAQKGLTPRQQGRRGTCSVFTVVGALEYVLSQRLSVEFLNWAGHKAANRTVDGGFFSELWEGYTVFGICPESEFPYRNEYDSTLQPEESVLRRAEVLRSSSLEFRWIKEWNPEVGLTASQFSEIKQVVANGSPVCGGFRWPLKAVWEDDILQMCPVEEVFDGHSVLLVGYRDDVTQPGGGVFLIRNSGGTGKDGFLPYAYAEKYMNDGAWIAP